MRRLFSFAVGAVVASLASGCAGPASTNPTAPSASPTIIATIVTDGDSRSALHDGVEPWSTWLASNLGGGQIVAVSTAVSGATTPSLITRAPQTVDPLLLSQPNGPHIDILWELANDNSTGASVDEMVAHYATYVADRKRAGSWRVIVMTDPPIGADPASGLEQKRLASNALIRTTWQNFHADGLIDLALAPRFAQVDLALYQADKLHLTTSGAQYIAQVVSQSPALLALLADQPARQ